MKVTLATATIALTSAMIGSIAPIQAATLSQIEGSKSISIGVQTDYPPYGYVDASLQPQGSDVATAKLIAEKLGVKLNLVTLTSPNRIPSLQTGKVDLVIAVLGKTPDREKVIDFSVSYAPFYSGIYAAKSLPIKSFADLSNKSVAVTRGSLQDTALTEVAPADAKIQRFEDDTSTVAAFVTGQAQALATSASVASVTMTRNPKLGAEYKVLLTDVTCYVGVAKGNTELLNKVNDILKTAKADGSLNAISVKYLGRPLGNLAE